MQVLQQVHAITAGDRGDIFGLMSQVRLYSLDDFSRRSLVESADIFITHIFTLPPVTTRNQL